MSQARNITIRYFPFVTVGIQCVLGILAGATGIMVFSTTDAPWAGWVLECLAVVIIAQAILLRDVTTLSVNADVLRVSHRKWYLARGTTSEVAIGAITAVVFRHVRAYRQEGAYPGAMHFWQMFVETDGVNYTPLFPDSAPLLRGRCIAQRLASHIGVPWRREEAAEYGRWIG